MIKLAVLICNTNNYEKYMTKHQIVLTMVDGVENHDVRLYEYLHLTDSIREYTKHVDGNLDYVKSLLEDFLHTSKAKKGFRILREVSLEHEVILVCDNMGLVFFSAILAKVLRESGIVVHNHGGENEI